jgi:hypothetical protein
MEQNDRLAFIESGMFSTLQDLNETTLPKWGKMNAQQMVEHLNDFFSVSIEKITFPLSTPEEHLPGYRDFLYSDKIFRENTKAPAGVLGEEPLALRNADLAGASLQLQQTVKAFFEFFKERPRHKTMHPAFGMLNFDEWIMLHYKHVTHHLRQFHLQD